MVDQFPIAQNSKIEIHRKAPPKSEVEIDDKNSGVFRWKATVAREEEKAFKTAYEVIYPREWDPFSRIVIESLPYPSFRLPLYRSGRYRSEDQALPTDRDH